MVRLMIVLVLSVLTMLACASSGPTAAAPTGWDYLNELQNFDNACPTLDLTDDFYAAMLRQGATCDDDGCQAYLKKLATVQDCRRSSLNTYLDTMGDQNWEMVSMEIITDPTHGIESTYRFVWKMPR